MISRIIVMEDNYLQLKLCYLCEVGERFDMDIEVFRRNAESETTWTSESGNKGPYSICSKKIYENLHELFTSHQNTIKEVEKNCQPIEFSS